MLLEHAPRRTASPASSALALGAALLLFAAAGASQRFAAPASARLTATSCDAITRKGECKSAASCEWRAADATCLAFAQGSGLKGGGDGGADNDDVAVGYDDDDSGKPAANLTTCGTVKKENLCGLYSYCEWLDNGCLPASIGLNHTNATNATASAASANATSADDDDDAVTCGTLTTQDDCSQESTCKWASASSTCLPS